MDNSKKGNVEKDANQDKCFDNFKKACCHEDQKIFNKASNKVQKSICEKKRESFVY